MTFLRPYPSSKLLLRRHARFDIEMGQTAFGCCRTRQNRKIVLEREFSLISAKHEADALFLFFFNLIPITTAAQRDHTRQSFVCVGNRPVKEVRYRAYNTGLGNCT